MAKKTPEIERFDVRMPKKPAAVFENGLYFNEIEEIWNICGSMAQREGLKLSQWNDPMKRVGGMAAYPAIVSQLFYWRKGEGWKIKRKPRWDHTLKRLFPKTLASMK